MIFIINHWLSTKAISSNLHKFLHKIKNKSGIINALMIYLPFGTVNPPVVGNIDAWTRDLVIII